MHGATWTHARGKMDPLPQVRHCCFNVHVSKLYATERTECCVRLHCPFLFVFLFNGLFAVAGQFTSLSPEDLFGVLGFLTDCPVPPRFRAVARVFWLLSASCKYCLYGLAVRTVGRPVVGVRRRRRETFSESDAFGRGLISAAEMKVDDVDDCMELLVEFPNFTGPFICSQSLCTSGSSAEHAQTRHGMGG